MPDVRADVRQLLEDLEIQVRLLKQFGVRCLRPAPKIQEAEQAITQDPLPGSAASLPVVPGYHFGEGRRARWDQSIQERIDRSKKPDSGAQPAPQKQSGLFGAKEPSTTPAAPVVGQGWKPSILPGDQVLEQLNQVRREIGDCTRCRLSAGRKSIVFGEGNPKAPLVFCGEGPGEEEDRTGRPFVGKAGQLLDKMIVAMGHQRGDVYICNVVKCRPPNNRAPQEDEMRTCGVFLGQQLKIIGPRHVICLGATAAKYLLNTTAPMNKVRGRFFDDASGARILPTFHPAYLLRTPSAKKLVWEDIQKVMAEMAEPVEL